MIPTLQRLCDVMSYLMICFVGIGLLVVSITLHSRTRESLEFWIGLFLMSVFSARVVLFVLVRS